MTEDFKYQVIKKLVDTNGNKQNAALKLGCSTRTINRMIQGYKESGKQFFVHGNKGRKPANAIPAEDIENILTLYENKYYDSNFTHFAELLAKHENIRVSKTFLRDLFFGEGILSPLATRVSRKKLRTQLEEAKSLAPSKREQDRIQELIVSLEERHPRRPRCAYFGEMIQMDASVYVWFGNEKAYLHLAVDDCTGNIVGGFFAPEETLKGYYNVLYQILTNHGIPYSFYTDKRTVFEYKRKDTSSLEKDTFTQFGYACKQLGIEIKTTSVPQAKGRIERMFKTMKSRLPIELRLAGVTTLEQANEFLYSYIEEFNAQFALPVNHNKSVFETQPGEEKINLILAVLTKRKIDGGHSIQFNKKFYFPVGPTGTPSYFRKGVPVMVIEAFDGNLFTVIHDTVYALEEIPQHEKHSRNFDLPEPAPEPKKRYVPPMSHPWRAGSFEKHVSLQPHRHIPDGISYEDLWYTNAIYL
ncbi:MAG TPA: ISNCY family transposase [Firmicutes bacterium]|nr:ISNCY family transposase [Bacillota bacterium]